MKKGLLVTVISVLALSVLFTGCQRKGESASKAGGYKIGFSNGYYGNTWRDQFISDFEKVAEEYKAAGKISQYTVSNADTDADQITAINSFIAQGVDAILVVPRVESALAPVVQRALAQKIKVICLDDSSWEGAYNVVLDNYNTMEVLTEWMVDEIGGKGNLVYITGLPGENWDTVRNVAVKDVLSKYPDVHILAEAPGSWSDVDANRAVTTFLNTYKNIDGVLAQDVMGRGIVQAFQTAQRPFVPLNGDSVNGFLKIWKELPGLNTFTYTFPPGIGATGLRIAVGLLDGKTFKPDSLSQNVTNPALKNSVVVPIPYYLVRNLPQGKPRWMNAVNPRSRVIDLEEALKVNAGQPDNVTMDYIMTQAEVDSLFQ
ncbi:sugar ABC transporter substrate-binding protein [Spirochaetia bacterium]|nr:sugar ABC transporter substrate-binding protein [Spirochaetia bacterium]